MKLKKQFEDFHAKIKAPLTVPLKEKKKMFEAEIKDKFPQICEENEVNIKKSDLDFFMQGSYSTKTAVSAYNTKIDLDLGVAFQYDIYADNDPRVIKGYMRDSIDAYNRHIKYKEPCLTVTYLCDGEETYHIDFPIYAVNNNKYYLARGKENSEEYKWELCDPKGLSDYINDYLSYNDQLRRVVRYLKCWKINSFSEGNEMPPSISLTLLACKYFKKKEEDGSGDDLEALYQVVKQIKDSINPFKDDPVYCVYLPREPFTDTMAKINSNKAYREKFKRKMYDFELQLRNAINATDEHSSGKYVQKVLGDDFDVPEKQVDEGESKYKRTSQFG